MCALKTLKNMYTGLSVYEYIKFYFNETIKECLNAYKRAITALRNTSINMLRLGSIDLRLDAWQSTRPAAALRTSHLDSLNWVCGLGTRRAGARQQTSKLRLTGAVPTVSFHT